MELVPYMSAVGSLMYLMVSTRPDLASTLSVLTRFMQNPGQAHWEGVKRCLRYLKKTASHGLLYRRTISTETKLEVQVTGYCDSSYGGETNMRRCTTGYVYLVGGAAISWVSKVQSRKATSSCEAEYVALARAGAEAIWLRNMLAELGLPLTEGVPIACDSQSAIKLTENPVYHERSKHIDIRAHVIREYVQNKEVKIKFISGELQMADYLTKIATRDVFEKCKSGTRVTEYPEVFSADTDPSTETSALNVTANKYRNEKVDQKLNGIWSDIKELFSSLSTLRGSVVK